MHIVQVTYPVIDFLVRTADAVQARRLRRCARILANAEKRKRLATKRCAVKR